MAILILALANCLLDIMSPGGPTTFKARRKILGFGVPRWPENAFPSLVPWTYQCAKAPHFLYYVPQNTHWPSSLKKSTPLPVQLPVQVSVTSNSTVLNSRLYCSFLFRVVPQGVMGHNTWMMIKNVKEFCMKTQYLLGRHLQLKEIVWWAKIMSVIAVVIYYFVLCPVWGFRKQPYWFSYFCSYTTKLSPPVLLAFQLPIKNRMCCVLETIYSKKPQHTNFLWLYCFINFE